MSAVELCAFTSTYTTPGIEDSILGSNVKISRSMKFFSAFVFKYLKGITGNARLHMTQLTRHLILLIKSAKDKVFQDKQNLESCSDCVDEKETNANEQLQIVALLQFVRFSLSPVESGHDDPRDAYNNFFKQNEVTLRKLVEIYS
jgi:hypothetical protein